MQFARVHHPLSEWEQRNLTRLRVFEGLREIGVLLMTFTPLDGALGDDALADIWPVLLALFAIGLALFLYGVIGERRLHDSG